MDIDKVRALTDLELGAELSTQRRHLYDLRFQLATRQLTDHSQLTQARRTVARVLTVMTERGLDESIVARPAPAPSAPARRGLRRSRSTTSAKSASSASSASKEAAPKAASGGNEE
jgi:large subunit ribosomal protein L29